MTIRVLIADDNALFRVGLARLLGNCPEVTVVGQATDAAEAVRKATLLRPDVVLMDLALPRGGSVTATRQMTVERPELPVCLLTSSERPADLFAAVRAGARGYLVKTVTLEQLCGCLRTLAEGGAVITPALAARLLTEFNKLTPAMPSGSRALDQISAREREVVEAVSRGATNKDIADTLVITANTVKCHLRNIFAKLGLRNRQQLAAFATQQGWVVV